MPYNVDTLHNTTQTLLDSLNRHSACRWDTLHIDIASNLKNIALPSSSHTSPLLFLGILAMFLLFAIIGGMYPSIIGSSFTIAFHERDRESIFSDRSSFDEFPRIIFTVFFVIIGGVYACIYNSGEGALMLEKLGLFMLFLLIFVVVKLVSAAFLTYVFFDRYVQRQSILNYLNIFSLLAIFLFPILVLRLYLNVNIDFYLDVITAIILIISLLMIAVKIFRIFYKKILDLFYILLYLCSLEILPVLWLIFKYKSIA